MRAVNDSVNADHTNINSDWSNIVEIEPEMISYAAVYDCGGYIDSGFEDIIGEDASSCHGAALVIGKKQISESIPNSFTCAEKGIGHLVESWLDIENTNGQLWERYAPEGNIMGGMNYHV